MFFEPSKFRAEIIGALALLSGSAFCQTLDFRTSFHDPASTVTFGELVKQDFAGNTIVVGRMFRFASAKDDISVQKYDSSGNLLWSTWVDQADDNSRCLGVDAANNIYVGGLSTDNSGFQSQILMKINPSGGFEWYLSPGAGYIKGMEVGADGHIVTVATVPSAGQGNNVKTTKYDTDGSVLWSRTFNGAANMSDYAAGVSEDQDSNIYVALNSDTGAGSDQHVIKYTSTGGKPWVKTYPAFGAASPYAIAIKARPEGGCVIASTRYNYSPGASHDIVTTSYNGAGNQVWRQVYDDASHANDTVNSLDIDASGNVAVTGVTFSNTLDEMVTTVYDLSGNKVWRRRLATPQGVEIPLSGTRFCSDGSLYVGLSYSQVNGVACQMVVKYGALGTILWSYKSPPRPKMDTVNALTVDSNDRAIVVGTSIFGINKIDASLFVIH